MRRRNSRSLTKQSLDLTTLTLPVSFPLRPYNLTSSSTSSALSFPLVLSVLFAPAVFLTPCFYFSSYILSTLFFVKPSASDCCPWTGAGSITAITASNTVMCMWAGNQNQTNVSSRDVLTAGRNVHFMISCKKNSHMVQTDTTDHVMC